MTILTCFIYTLHYFDAFSGTNLLTRCRSANSCFLLFLVSKILHRKYSRNWTKQKPKALFFHGVFQNTEGETERGHEVATHLAAWPRGGAPSYGVGPSGPLRCRPFAYIILQM
jgi:hypothetical protein